MKEVYQFIWVFILFQSYYIVTSFILQNRNVAFDTRKFLKISDYLSYRKQKYIYDFVLNAGKFKQDQYFSEEIDMTDLDTDDDDGPKFNNPSSPTTKNDNEWMFFDVAKINVKGGDGGNGCMAMRREWKVDLGGPCGGNGGHGGNVYLECDDTLNTLSLLRRRVHHRARDGTGGRGSSQHGTNGEECIIPVPPGTIVRGMIVY